MPAPDPPETLPKTVRLGKISAAIKMPGVYVEEISTPPAPIPGVDTSTAAFIGAALEGPAGTVSDPITSVVQFNSIYGDSSDLHFSDAPSPTRNYLALAVQSFFDNGGKRLYIVRVAAADGSGNAPGVADYIKALSALECVDDISIVAAPGATAPAATGSEAVVPIYAALIAHVSRPQAYRFAVLDPPAGCSNSDIEAIRSQIDSKHAALYYPWITIANPLADSASHPQINVPPSGSICGIYARTDVERGVFKAPANQQITGATGFERQLTARDSDLLNPLGINCLRFFPGKGNLVFGARTVSTDAEWKYINISRYLLYLEQSIDRGLQWVVFEPNGEKLWTSIRSSINNFLNAEWHSGALLGAKQEDAFFVRCDLTTMTQADIDNGQLICLIGVALIKPAEFVIFRIGWKKSAS